MVRLGQDAALRFDRRDGSIHGIVEGALDIDGHLSAVIVDIDFSQEEAVTLHDVIHALLDRKHMSEEDIKAAHDAVEAHAQGLASGEDLRAQLDAQANSDLANKFAGKSDAEITELAADGDPEAQQERARRKTLATAKV